jgi:ABC-type amino acid transport substrate-binding protein
MQEASKPRPATSILLVITFVIACVGLFLPRPADSSRLERFTSVLDSVRATRLLRIGFEGYPPFASQDPRTGSMSGYSVDLATRIADEAGWKIEWIKTSADTKIADLKTGKFDVMVEPIFETIPRAREVTFTQPFNYNGFASAIVRSQEHRFKVFTDLDKPGIKVVVRQGYTDEAYAKEWLKYATVVALRVEDTSLIFLDVLSGKADVALADTSQVKVFHKEHQKETDMLFTNPPPAFVPAGFMLPQGDFVATNFFNSALSYLDANGVLDALDQKYDVSAFRPARQFK